MIAPSHTAIYRRNKMTTLNPVRKSILIGLAVLGMAGASIAVQAQAPAAAEGRHGHALSQEQRQAKWSEHRAKRQAKLHDALKLTAAQEPAWATFVASARPAAHPARGERGAWKAMPAPQRMEKAIELSKHRTAMMEQRLGALKSFYAVLTPEQQKVFDQHGMRGGHRGHHGKRMMHS
jgi:protein CpxP